MTKLLIYGLEASPPVRSVILALKALQLPFELITVNLQIGEHLTPEFLQRNPQHTVPVLEDEGVSLWDSHAIMAYLVRKYGKDDALYPKDYHKRAVVDQRLHFDSGVMFTSLLLPITRSILFMGETVIPRSKIDAIDQLYELLETFLGDNDYIAGPELTIADFSYLTTICALSIYLELDIVKYSRIAAWLERMKELPYYEVANGTGAALLEAKLKSKNFTIEA